MKKRFLSALLFVAMMFTMSISSFAAGDIKLSVDANDSDIAVGDTFTATVELSGNPGVESIQVDITYNTSVLTCTDVKVGALISSSGAMYAGNKNNNGKVSFAAISAFPIESDGVLVTLTFKAKADGNCTITPVAREILSNGEKLSADISKDTVTVESSQLITPPAQTPEEVVPPTEIPEQVPEVPATPAAVEFSDVPPTHWAYTYVQNAVKNGLFSGIGNGLFGPAMNVTRGMFVTTLYSSAGSPDVELSNFADVPANAWYAKAVAWASQQGIVSGIGNNKFGPDMPITREQIALILFNYADGVSPGTEAFVRMAYPDAKDIHDWAMTAFTWAMNKDLISGKSGNLLDPLATATRAEVAVIMQNFVNLSK